MIYLSAALAIFWLGTLVHAQRHRRALFKWQDTAISKYISHDRTLQIGFVSLALSLLTIGIAFKSIDYVLPLFAVAAVGALFVMMTETVIDNQRLHILAAGTTYGAALVGAVLISLTNQFLLGLAVANILYAAYGAIVQDEVGDAERYIALGITGWLVGVCVL